MRSALAARSVAALMAALALCAHAANAATSGGGTAKAGSGRVMLAALADPFAAPADSCHHCICFTMPTRYVNGDTLSDGFRQWRVGYQNQSLVWRDSVAVNGPAWGRDPANFAKWRPDAQVKWFRSGYARPGERVCVDSLPPVMSLDWPYWYRAQSKTGVWSDISNPCGPFRNNDW